MPAELSVVINNYNYGRFIAAAIDSVLQQDVPAQLVVVDDGSTDDSLEVISRYRGKLCPVFKENAGQASCFNAGFTEATGGVVLFLDADDLLLPGAVRQVAGLFEEGVVQVHWAPQEVDVSGVPTGALKPERLVPHGDVFPLLARRGPRSFTNTPTSGNAWGREALARLLPMPEQPFALCADAYLHVMVPTYGRIARSLTPLSAWRRHGENRYNAQSVPLDARIAEERRRYSLLSAALRSRLGELGIDADEKIWRQRSAPYRRLLRVSQALVQISTVVAHGGHVLLVDDGDWDDGFWDGRMLTTGRAVSRLFGTGELPPDATSERLIDEIELRRRSGATHAAFVWPGRWVLDHFPGLGAHLEQVHETVDHRGPARVFRLRGPEERTIADSPRKAAASGPRAAMEEIEAQLEAVGHSLAEARAEVTRLTRERWAASPSHRPQREAAHDHE